MLARRDRELLTPHKVVVLVLIVKYGKLHPVLWGSESENPENLYVPYQADFDPAGKKAICVLVAKLLQGSDMTLSDLMQLIDASNIPKPLVTSFLMRLQQIQTGGIDGFISLFDSVSKFCEQDQARTDSCPCLWTSLAGLHVRQMSLAFRRLSFFCVATLYDKLCAHYIKCMKDNPTCLDAPSICQSMQQSDIQDETLDMSVDMDESDMSDRAFSSDLKSFMGHDKVHSLIEEEAKLPLKDLSIPSVQISTRHQAENFIQQQLSLLIKQAPGALPPPELQRHLNGILKCCPDLGKGHFLSYINCLRMKEFTGAMHSLIRAYDSKFMHKDPSRGDDITRTFRYAALNIAGLQAHFGHRELSLMALEEAIRLSQESNDHLCLQYALAWLYTLSSENKAKMIKISHDRGKNLNQPYLSWLSLLNHTVESCRNKAPPATLLQNLFGKITLGNNQEHHILEGGVSGQAGLWSVQSSLWTLWGNLPVASMCSQLVLHLEPQLDLNLHTPSSVNPTCVSVCNMALTLSEMGEYHLASSVLQYCQQQFPPPWENSKHWLFTQAFIGFYEALFQGLWPEANSMADSMATTHPIHAKMLKAELLVSKGEYTEALRHTTDLRNVAWTCDTKVKSLIIEAQAQAGGKNLGSALSTLVEAIALANEFHLAYLAAIANLQLASVQMHLGLIGEAKLNVNRGIIVILSGGGLADNARTKLLLAKLETCSTKGEGRSKCLHNTADRLEEVQHLFVKLKAYARVKETLYLRARLYNESGHIEGRNRTALEFRRFEEEHPNVYFSQNTSIF